MKEKLIEKSLAEKVMMVSVIFRTTKPCGGGVSTVLECYDKFFDGLRHIPTWKYTNPINKAWFFFYHWMELVILLAFDRRLKIVHIHTAAGASFRRKMIVAKTARLFRKKVILHMHAADFREYYAESDKQEWIRNSINDCDKLIVLSPQWKDYFTGIGIDVKKIIILNNIVAMPDVKRSVCKDKTPVRMLFMGTLSQRKGIRDLLSVIIEHHNELRGKYMLRFGGNEDEDIIKKILADNKLDDVARFEGWVTGEKKQELQEWANTYILPSYNEGLPISILEALAYGMPVISTPVGGIPEVVKNGRNGILVEPGNKEEIWAALKHYLDNPACIDTEGKESIKIVEPFTPNYVLAHLKKIYEEVI